PFLDTLEFTLIKLDSSDEENISFELEEPESDSNDWSTTDKEIMDSESEDIVQIPDDNRVAVNELVNRLIQCNRYQKIYTKITNGEITVTYKKHDLVLLPSHYSCNRLHTTYNLMNLEKYVSYSSFQRIWKRDAELQKIIIRKPSKDVCDECILFKHAIKECDNYIDETLDEQFAMHMLDYRMMREAYEDDIQIAKKGDQSSFRVFSFNFSQNVDIPHNPSNLEVSILNSVPLGLIVIAFKNLYSFQIKGHTRNSVDRGFEIWCIDQLVNVINDSAKNNISVNLEDQI
ncbi:18755_t:CDS:2, partial [Racocetra fulgida]